MPNRIGWAAVASLTGAPVAGGFPLCTSFVALMI